MKTATRTLLLAGALGALLLPVAGCRQSGGKSCQTTTDCKKGLVCCFDGTSASSTLGVCTAEAECNASPPDAAVQPDAQAQPDARVQTDAQAQPDAQVTLDASVTQDASP